MDSHNNLIHKVYNWVFYDPDELNQSIPGVKDTILVADINVANDEN